jgi:hypothetical protein
MVKVEERSGVVSEGGTWGQKKYLRKFCGISLMWYAVCIFFHVVYEVFSKNWILITEFFTVLRAWALGTDIFEFLS